MPYTIQGETVDIPHEPQLKDGTLWVPFRALSEALGGNVDWDPDNRVAILYHGPYITTLKVGDTEVDVDGQKVQLQAAPYVDKGDTWVPVRFFERPLGYQVSADPHTRSVEIFNPAA